MALRFRTILSASAKGKDGKIRPQAPESMESRRFLPTVLRCWRMRLAARSMSRSAMSIWGQSIWGQVLYFAAIRNRHADRGAWMTAAHEPHGYTLTEIAATVGLPDTRPDPYCVRPLRREIKSHRPVHAHSILLEGDPQMAVIDAAGVDRQFGPVFRDVAQVFLARRGAVLLQLGRPLPNVTGLKVETALMPSANQATVLGDGAGGVR